MNKIFEEGGGWDCHLTLTRSVINHIHVHIYMHSTNVI